ncbi:MULTISPECIES: hypothetical protein [Nostocales]|jgi:hypothetical protein|uniref:hypothetical protein n=1 Tax=Nostocales TaxID=1161 RepID=UPI00029B6F40|nr:MULTISPECIES: hypothetical protein [Nostocales]MBO1056187.1 hypothetical protein [Dolichospermum sp. JUN01]MBS9389388.1 hypothetical protein [Dolichospermum sp. WA123]MBS9392303.1 hypothetical protein [Dolichospermum sp. OL01]MCO5795946.1 hypothetical protein [Dolichospermum sp. OL03]MCS6279466.1 hypothetical protein [Dolichospermum sp.]QSV57603.1 MAG: hypothetical protein HEQ29_03840 [Dolichospermum sp. LBC05a]
MSKQNILSQKIPSDLVVELSIEEQQLLSGSGGHRPRNWSRGWVWGRRPRRHW